VNLNSSSILATSATRAWVWVRALGKQNAGQEMCVKQDITFVMDIPQDHAHRLQLHLVAGRVAKG
jgi:hypothetical protein